MGALMSHEKALEIAEIHQRRKEKQDALLALNVIIADNKGHTITKENFENAVKTIREFMESIG